MNLSLDLNLDLEQLFWQLMLCVLERETRHVNLTKNKAA